SSNSRMLSAIGVPPGSRVTIKSTPSDSSVSDAFFNCVDLPTPSVPSKVIKRPRAFINCLRRCQAQLAGPVKSDTLLFGSTGTPSPLSDAPQVFLKTCDCHRPAQQKTVHPHHPDAAQRVRNPGQATRWALAEDRRYGRCYREYRLSSPGSGYGRHICLPCHR